MGRSQVRWVDRCVCGHVKDRHEVVVTNRGRMTMGRCGCGCLGFTAAGGKSITPTLPSSVEPDDQLVMLANIPVDTFTRSTPDGWGTALASDDTMIEAFDAWRCANCGSRSPKNQRCEVRPSCRSRWLEPVRVEIHGREVADGP